MRVIIIYASAGAGHFRAAQAIYSYFKEHHKEIDVKIIDVLSKTNALFKLGYNYGYSFLVKYALFIWWWGFRITYNKSLRLFIRPIATLINRLNTKNFVKFLIKEKPDFIISTHFLPSEISANLKINQKINSKLVTIITDFGIHPFWISKGIDIYIVASGFSREKLIIEGVKDESIKEFGIPMDSKFLVKYDKDILLNKFNLEQNKFTVLIATGSFGMGPIEKIVDLLYNDVQILVVCAHNRRLYERLKNKNYPRVLIFGFIDNIQELMAISEVIITKPGGLTIQEVLAKELVPIFISAIPGQETENAKVLENYGVGLSVANVNDIKKVILDYKDHPEKLNKIKAKIKEIKKPFASQALYNALCQKSSI